MTLLPYLDRLARLLSVVGGLIMVALMLMTCYSVAGRNFFGSALVGDFELTGIGCGAAMACFMPLCQLRRGNIIVDFFTSGRSARFNHRLDRFGDLLMTALFALLAWRCGWAAASAKANMGASMLLGFPDWIVLTSMSIPFGLTALIAGTQALARFAPAPGEPR
jgi:TRAP-type C4-dicarboxylate transport system permease small subunit